MKRTILLCLLLAALAITVSGTVAYFTDTVQGRGVITSGNLDIVQREYERVKDSTTGDYTDKVQPYTQKQMIYPCVMPSADSDYHTHKVTVSGHQINLANQTLCNFVDKIVVAENTGSLNAYVRTFVAIPAHYYIADDNTQKSVSWLHLDKHEDDGWVWAEEPLKNVLIDDEYYDIHYATNIQIIAPDASAAPSLLGFYLDPHVSQKGQIYTYKTADGEEIELGSEAAMTILVATEASQANVFTHDSETGKLAAEVALDTTYGIPSKDRHPWSDFEIVTTTEELTEKLTAAESKYDTRIGLKDGTYVLPSNLPNGVTIFAMGLEANATAENSLLTAYDVELNGLTFTSGITLSGHGSYHDVIFKQGWTASPTSGNMLFESCSFDEHTITTDSQYTVTMQNCRKLDGTSYTE